MNNKSSWQSLLGTFLLTIIMAVANLHAANIAIVHDNDDPQSDTEMIDRLTNTLGHSVTLFDEGENDPVDLSGQDLLIISSTIQSGNVAGAYRDSDIPILFTEFAISDEMNISGGGGNQGAGFIDVEIINDTHFITEGLLLDFIEFMTLDFTDSLLRLSPGGSGEHAPGMDILALAVENIDWVFLGAIDRGAELNDGSSAINRRVYYGIPNEGFFFLNDTGWQVFDRIVEWLLETPETPFAVERSVNPTLLLDPQGTVDVTLTLSVLSGTPSPTLVETLPDGWIASNVSASDGSVDSPDGQITWSLSSTTGVQSLTYQLNASEGAQAGLISGEAQMDGNLFPITGDVAVKIATVGEPVVYLESDGMVVIEAENFYISTVDVIEPLYRWVTGSSGEVVTEPGADFGTAGNDFSGDYIHANVRPRTDRGNPNDDFLAELSYRIEFTTEGTYFLWVHENDTAGGQSNTTHTNFDSRERPGTQLIGSGEPVWLWDNGKGDDIVSYDLTAGVHQYFIWVQETGIALDKIILTTDENFVPSGLGPPESDTRADTQVDNWELY